MKLLMNMMHHERKWVWLTIGLGLISSFVNLWWNSSIIKIINHISDHHSVPSILWVYAVIGILLTMLSNFLLTVVSGWTCETMNHELRLTYARHFIDLEYIELEKTNVGGQMSFVQNEIAEASTFITGNLFGLIQNMISFIITLGFLIYLNPILTLATNGPVLLIVVYVIFSSKVIGGLTNQRQEQKKKMNRLVDTLVGVFPVLHIYEAQEYMCQKYNEAVDGWQQTSIKEEKIKARLMSLSAVLSCVPLLILLLVGGSMVIRHVISIGVVYAFINLSKNVSGVLMNMPGWIGAFRHFLANVDRIEAKLNASVMKEINYGD